MSHSIERIVEIADFHNRDESEFFSSKERFYDWFVDQPFNDPTSVFIDAGDHFHRARPSPREYGLTFRWLKRLRFNRMFWVAGNHDTLSNGVSLSLHPLEEADPRIEVIRHPCLKDIDGFKILFLPFEYHTLIKGVRVPRVEYYSLLADQHPEWHHADLLVHHFPDDSQTFGKKKGVDLSPFEAKVIKGGDIHLKGPTYVGSPVPTRFDEMGQSGRVWGWDLVKGEELEHQVPRFVDFVTVKYGDEPSKNPEGETLLVVTDAPSKQAAIERYGDRWTVYSVQFIGRQIASQSVEIRDDSDRLSLSDHLASFIDSRKLSASVSALLHQNFVQPPI